MLSKIFRKGETPSNTASEQPPQIAAEALLAAQEANQAVLKAEWESKLQSAMGNEAFVQSHLGALAPGAVRDL